MLRFALGVAFALAAAALAGSTPALANCQPDPVSDGDTVNCTVAGGTQTTPVGTGENNVTVNVQTGATIDVSGTPSEGIDLGHGNTVTNAGTIIVDNGAAISARDNNIITNTGTIIGGFGASGISVGSGNVVTNIGSIVVGDFGTGIVADDANVVTNLGTIIAGDSGTGISVVNGNAVVNSGTIRVGFNGTGIDVCCDNNVTNSGSIVGLDGAFGIFAGNSSNIANTGSITVGAGGFGIFALGDGLTALGGKATISNSGTITVGDFGTAMAAVQNYNVINSGVIVASTGGIGILVDDGSAVVNSGTIRVGDSGALLAAGIVAAGDNSTVNNSGTISGGAGAIGINVADSIVGPTTTGPAITNSGTVIVGAGGTGVNFEASGSLINTGLIRATASGFSVFSCNCATTNISNYGTLDGKIETRGVTTTFTNSGLITITDTNALTPIAQFNFNISDFNGGGGGSFEQTAAGTLSLRVMPGAPAPIDSLLADSVALAGTLRVAIQPGLYTNTTITDTAVSITHNGAANITTTFDRFVSSSPFFTVTPIYNGFSGTAADYDFLTLQLDRIGFGSVPGLTPNQQAVGNALEGSYSTTLTGNAATFFSNLLAATSVTVLDQISGEGISAAQNAAFSAGSLFNNAMQTQGLFAPDLGGLSVVIPPAQYAPAATRAAPGHEAFASLGKTPPPAQRPGSLRIWTAGFGASQSLHGEADPGSASQSVRSAGGVLGVDWQAAWDLRVGFAAGGSESTFSAASLATSGRMTGGHVGVYGMKTWGAYYAAASLGYARFDSSTTRTITGIGPTETASGRFGSDLLSARLELGWKQAYGRFNVTPFVAVEPSVVWQRGYTESGTGILGLTVASHTATSLPTFVGVQFDGRYITPEGAVLTPYSRLSWVHEFEPDRRVSAAFITVPGASFTVGGARPASDAGRLDTGAKLTFRGGLALFANFTGEWSDRTQTYAGTGGFRYAW